MAAENQVVVSILADDKTDAGLGQSEGRFEKFKNFVKENFAQIFVLGEKLQELGTKAADFANKLIDGAVESQKAFFNLQNAVDAANQQFKIGTLDDWKTSLKSLGDELKIYSDKDLANASARMIDMTKRLGFSQEQMIMLTKVTGNLGAGMGDLNGNIERIAGAMRGEAESAEYLGLSLNDNTVKVYAQAHGLLWEKLTDAEKAQVRYNVLLEQASGKMSRASEYANTFAGKNDLIKKRIEELYVEMGEKLIPIKEKLMAIVIKVIDWYSSLDDSYKALIAKGIAFAAIMAPILALFAGIAVVIPIIVTAIGTLYPALIALGALIVGLLAGSDWNWQTLFAKIKGYITGLYDYILASRDRIYAVLAWLRDKIAPVIEAIGEAVWSVLGLLWGIFEQLFMYVYGWVIKNWEVIVSVLESFWNMFLGIVDVVLSGLTTLGVALLQLIEGDWRGAFASIWDWAGGWLMYFYTVWIVPFWDMLWQLILLAWTYIKYDAIIPAFNWITEELTKTLDKSIEKLIQWAIDCVEAFQPLIDVLQWISDMIEAITGRAAAAGRAAQRAAEAAAAARESGGPGDVPEGTFPPSDEGGDVPADDEIPDYPSDDDYDDHTSYAAAPGGRAGMGATVNITINAGAGSILDTRGLRSFARIVAGAIGDATRQGYVVPVNARAPWFKGNPLGRRR